MSFSNNVNSFNLVYNVCQPGERTEILAWLSPFEQRIQHGEVRSCRVPDVGGHLLLTEVFESWSDVSRRDESDNPALFCYGNPGVGKTFINSLVVDTLGDRPTDQSVIVACFYFDFASRREQSPADMLGALLRQVVIGLGEIPGEVVKAYRDNKKVAGGRGLRLSEILEMLQTVSTSQRTFICVDALDECVVGHREVVLKSLRGILEKSPGTRLFLTGRSNIRSEIRRLFAEKVSFINIKPNKRDTITYILAKLEEDTNKDAMSPNLRTDVLTKIPAMAPEMAPEILLVSLAVEAILEEQKVSTRRDRLKAMPSSLEGPHARMLGRVKAQGPVKEETGMAALMWVSHSERPLSADELRHALGVKIGAVALDPDNIPSVETLLECCQGLLVVDKEAPTVRLSYSALKEYLSSCPGLFDSAHSTIAETCLTYLNFQRFKGTPTSDFHDPIPATFLGYSSIHWGTHAKRQLSDCAKSLALRLFGGYGNHISAKLLLKQVLNPDHFSNIEGFSSFTGLHCASFFGIVDIVAALTERNGCDIEQIDCVGYTPLKWATTYGHDEVVKLLQERRNVIPDIPGRPSHTPPPRATNLKRKRMDELIPPPESGAPKCPRAT